MLGVVPSHLNESVAAMAAKTADSSMYCVITAPLSAVKLRSSCFEPKWLLSCSIFARHHEYEAYLKNGNRSQQCIHS